MIRIAIVDDHPAIRLGLETALAAEPEFVPVGTASTAAELAPLLYRTDPDVVLLDYHLPGADGLGVCRELKSDVPAPCVILYSAFADDSMTVPAIVAGADGLLHKGVRPQELFTAVRDVAAGGSALPSPSPSLLEAAGLQLDVDDLPILAMLVDPTSANDIAATLAIEPAELRAHVGPAEGAGARARAVAQVRARSTSAGVTSPTTPTVAAASASASASGG